MGDDHDIELARADSADALNWSHVAENWITIRYSSAILPDDLDNKITYDR